MQIRRKFVVWALAWTAVAAFGQAQTPAERPKAPTPKRLYIEQRFINGASGSTTCVNGNCNGGVVALSRNLSLEATKGFVKSCPEVTITDNKDSADYMLRIDRGDSALYRQNGDGAYISPAKNRVANLVKHVSNYIKSQQTAPTQSKPN